MAGRSSGRSISNRCRFSSIWRRKEAMTPSSNPRKSRAVGFSSTLHSAKNWPVVRGLVGYDRYSSKEALAQLNRLYQLVRLYTNFFQPVMQLQQKTRQGARVHKLYDQARTPYPRVLEPGVLTDQQQAALIQQYQRLNPVRLRTQLDQALQRLWELAETKGCNHQSVTLSVEATTALR